MLVYRCLSMKLGEIFGLPETLQTNNAPICLYTKCPLRSPELKGKKNRIEGLLTVWDLLTADAVGTDGKEHTSCFLRFDDALEAFFDRFKNIEPPYLNTDKDKFQYALLHEQWGLCVYIITHEESKTRFVVLRPDEIDLSCFLIRYVQRVTSNSPQE